MDKHTQFVVSSWGCVFAWVYKRSSSPSLVSAKLTVEHYNGPNRSRNQKDKSPDLRGNWPVWTDRWQKAIGRPGGLPTGQTPPESIPTPDIQNTEEADALITLDSAYWVNTQMNYQGSRDARLKQRIRICGNCFKGCIKVRELYSAFANSCPMQTDTFLFPLIHSHNVIFSSNKF